MHRPTFRKLTAVLLLLGCFGFAADKPADLYYGKNLKQFYSEAGAAFQRQDFPTAISRLKRALEIAPGHGPTMWEMAQIYAASGDKANALAMLERVAELKLGYDPRGHQLFTKLRDDADFKHVAARFDASTGAVHQATPAFTMPERDLIAEGIAYDPETKALFVSSIFKHKIVAVDAQGRTRDFKQSGEDGLLQVLGMKVDARRRLLWAASYANEHDKENAGRAAVHKYDLRTGKLIKKYELQPKPAHLLNDVAFTRAGDLYVTDSQTGGVYVIRHDRDELEQFLPADTFAYPNGIAISADESKLYVASWGPGVSIVNLKTKGISQLAQPSNVTASDIDGLYLYKNSLIGVQNGLGNDRAARFYLNASGDAIVSAEVLESRNPLFDIPTTGSIVGDDFYLLANAQLSKLNKGEIAAPTNETKILRIRLK
ncbi:MAG TPA: SMP-30/gluconolactonase/LRE family protein [Clostridia bacterium]|nr:SMP-30/gluconolactonase/LRE family protein [Clostridia bacterium]